LFLELLIYRYYRDRTGGTDREVREGLEFLKRQLGPILLVEGSLVPGLGEHLLEGITDYLKESGLSREEALEGVEATLAFLGSFSGSEGGRELEALPAGADGPCRPGLRPLGRRGRAKAHGPDHHSRSAPAGARRSPSRLGSRLKFKFKLEFELGLRAPRAGRGIDRPA
jgi:hypothetical protein